MRDLLFLEGKYEEAINYITNEVFKKNVADSELDSEMYYLIGTAAFEMKDYEEAIQGFEKAAKLSNGNSKYYRDLAISYARAGDFQKKQMKACQSSKKNWIRTKR
ncbi:hypothetical protein GCM10020331_055530 [Ectobacillus funiculus]